MSEKPSVTASGGRTAADYRDVADKLRSRVDVYGKTLAGLATVGTGAVGLAKLSDLYPEDADPSPPGIVIAVLGLLFAAAGAITIAVMLMKAGDAAVVEVDPSDGELSREERGTISPIFTATARRFGFSSLPALAEKESSLRRSVTRLPAGEARTDREARADELRVEIALALARGQVAVVRKRATKAVSGTVAKCCYAAVALGLVAFALAADWSSQDRGDRIATAKACAEARKAGATKDDLKKTKCANPGAASTADSPSPEELRTGLALRLTRLLTLCEKDAASKQTSPWGSEMFGPDDCDLLRDAITKVVSIRRVRLHPFE